MSEWKPDLYLKFEQQRSMPARDLANRLRVYHPETVLDLGCGPGNSTAILKEVFPDSKITGIDVSEQMIDKARILYPELDFQMKDLRHLEIEADLIYSNACLQWVPDHVHVIPKLISLLRAGGVLAVQVPMNQDEPLYRIIKETAKDFPYDFKDTYFEQNELLTSDEYYDLLSGCMRNVEIWETTYMHEMNSHEELIQWVRSTRLRPYFACLTPDEQTFFEQELLQRVKKQYVPMKNGRILLKFRRLFFVAQKI